MPLVKVEATEESGEPRLGPDLSTGPQEHAHQASPAPAMSRAYGQRDGQEGFGLTLSSQTLTQAHWNFPCWLSTWAKVLASCVFNMII